MSIVPFWKRPATDLKALEQARKATRQAWALAMQQARRTVGKA